MRYKKDIAGDIMWTGIFMGTQITVKFISKSRFVIFNISSK